jgi:cellulose synthase/poly-beta-1,6-N-acetylglucosamine synthase-like glycosyltransferase
MVLTILWWLLALAFIAALAGWFLPGLGILRAGPTLLKPSHERVSVIVACGKSSDPIIALLDNLFTQKYPDFEVIVILNGEALHHEVTLAAYASREPRLKVLKSVGPGKKEALTVGIQAARYDVLLFTDADCLPASPFWIREMAAAVCGPFGGVLGYSPVKPAPGWFNMLARFDHFLVGIQYLGAAAWGYPYMGVGRNLAYRRQVFDETGGFEAHRHLASGDDDLLVQAAARRHRFQVQWHPESFVYTEASSGLISLLRRKARHFTTASHFRLLPFVLLQAHFWGRFGVWTSPFVLAISGVPVPLSFFFVIFYILTVLWIWKPLSTKLCEKSLWVHALWCDPVLTFVWLGAGIFSLFRNKLQWN